MDKDNEKDIALSHIKDNLYGIAFPSLNMRLIFCLKKTERIAGAIYILSNTINQLDPLRTQLRQTSLSLLSTMSSGAPLESVRRELSVLLSLLDVASRSNLIPSNQVGILLEEISRLWEVLEKDEVSMSVNQDFFSKGLIFPKGPESPKSLKQEAAVANQGQQGQLVKKNRLNLYQTKTNRPPSSRSIDKNQMVLNCMQKGHIYSIKDITASVSSLGEKTVQRELVALVAKGLVLKTGERRWSRYSLV